MSAPIPRAAVAMAVAVDRAMRSAEWADAPDDEERAYLVVEELCRELHPLGAVLVPSVHTLCEALDRDDRNDAIRAEFDGRNYGRLARKHRISTRQVRRIVDGPRRP